MWVLRADARRRLGHRQGAGGDDQRQDNRTVSLKTQIPVVIFYLTARVEEDGTVDFFDDIYGYDAEMQKVLAKGPPYPVKPEPVVPKTKPGDTV